MNKLQEFSMKNLTQIGTILPRLMNIISQLILLKMALDLLQTVQQNLNFPPLQKIDPNTQEVKHDSNTPNEHRFSQAAIPAILTGLYAYSAKDDNAEAILRGDLSSDWVSKIFGNRKQEVVEKISQYSFYGREELSGGKLNDIATEAVRVTRNGLSWIFTSVFVGMPWWYQYVRFCVRKLLPGNFALTQT